MTLDELIARLQQLTREYPAAGTATVLLPLGFAVSYERGAVRLIDEQAVALARAFVGGQH